MVKNILSRNKKSQAFLISFIFISLLFIFSYYIETQNFYISKSSNYNLMNNIKFETCRIARISNGSYIDNRLSNFKSFIKKYCYSLNDNCSLIINKSLTAPTNLSKLNYTYYNFILSIKSFNGLDNITTKFNCIY